MQIGEGVICKSNTHCRVGYTSLSWMFCSSTPTKCRRAFMEHTVYCSIMKIKIHLQYVNLDRTRNHFMFEAPTPKEARPLNCSDFSSSIHTSQ